MGQDNVANAAITSLQLDGPLATSGGITSIMVGIVAELRQRKMRPGARRLELWVGKARASKDDPPFEMRPAQQQVVTLGRSTSTFYFQHKFTSPGEYVIQARLDPDALELDDVRSAVVTVRKDVPVLLVDGKANEPQILDRAAETVRSALRPREDLVPGMIPVRPKVVNETQFADGTLGDLTEYDCVFLCDVARLTIHELHRLEAHVRRGGGVVISLGDHVDLGAYNDLLYRNGQGLLPAYLEKKYTAPEKIHFQFTADAPARREPPLKAFGEDNDMNALMGARFRTYVRARIADKGGPRKVLTFVPVASNPKAGAVEKELKSQPVNDPALIEWQPPVAALLGDAAKDRAQAAPTARARGRVMLLTTTTGWDWNSWPASPSYLPMMHQLLELGVAGRLREQFVTVGEPFEEILPPGASADATLVTPVSAKDHPETVHIQAGEDANILRWTDTDASGIYSAVIGSHPQEHLFAVNVPTTTIGEESSESDPKRATREDLQNTYKEWEFQVVTDPKDVSHTGGPTAKGTEKTYKPLGPEIALWLLRVVLVLVFLEVILAFYFGHFTSAPANERKAVGGRWLPILAATVTLLTIFILGGILISGAHSGEYLGFLRDSYRQWIFEKIYGISPAAPGEGNAARIDWEPFLVDGSTDVWLAAGIALLGGGLIFAIYYRLEQSAASAAYKVILFGLRLLIVLLCLVVLLPQITLHFERKGFPDVVVILDDSQSMSTPDNYQDPRVKAAADQLIADASLPGPERLRLAQALVTRPDGDWLTRLLMQRKAKVHVYRCSTRAARIADVVEADQIKDALTSINALKATPENDSSQLGTAVRQVVNDFRGSSLSAVIMLTDGVTTEGEDLTKASKYAAQMGIPLFFIGMGDSHEARDIYPHDLQAPDTVFVNDNIVFDLRVTGSGFGDQTVPLELREKGKDAVLKSTKVKLNANGTPVKVSVSYRPTDEGEKIYELKVPVQDGETDPNNNVLERLVTVRKAKLIKVLYVEGSPRWEFRYLKTLLERESQKVVGNKSIDLKVLLVDSDREWAEQDRSAITEFPTKAELNQYDVVILGDVDPKSPRFPKMAEHLQHLADFVKERGGGLAMLAGPRFAPFAYKGTPLQDVLPIDLLVKQQPQEPAAGYSQGYRPELTPIGRSHPIFRFDRPDERESEEVWNGLKELYWFSEGYEAKRAAEVLVTHPRMKHGKVPQAVQSAGLDGHPLVVQHFVGTGRCLFFGIDETWRWRFREDELNYNKFWIQTVRYLARSRTGQIELRLDKQTPYRRGEPIRVTVRFPDDQPPPPPETEVKVVIERRPARGAEPETQTVQLAKIDGSRSSYETLITRTPEGEYQFSLSSPAVQGARPRAECKVLAPPNEMEVLRMNEPDMQRAAEETRGGFYTLADADRVFAELPAGTRVTLNSSAPPLPLWNGWWVFALILGLLTMEWVMRKRKNLL